MSSAAEYWRSIDSLEPYPAFRIQLLRLYVKARNHQAAYEEGRKKEHLTEAAHWFGQCISLIEYINNTLERSGPKQDMLARFYGIFEAAINCRYHLYQETGDPYHLEEAFGYAERGKALSLKDTMEIRGWVAPGNSQEEQLHKTALSKQENRWHAWRQQRGDGGLPFARIRESLLAPGQALLQYFLGEEYLFVFVINGGKTALARQPVRPELTDAVHRFRESVYGWSLLHSDSLLREYTSYGYRLYDILMRPVAHLLPARLIIVPDGILEYIPFEALLREPTEPTARPLSAYPFLIRKHQVSYAHSARLLQEMKNTAHKAPRHGILAFAPSFPGPVGGDCSTAARHSNLGRLVGNVKEVQGIKRLLRTRIYTGNDATLERFLADAPHYSIIHLATHAKANNEAGEYAYLAFTEVPDTLQNELLYAKDLYALHLPADMVVLSACESGLGDLRPGQAGISLARGFAHAGAKSLVSTLWRVSDRGSAALMQQFYRQLKAGVPKDEALRAAKLRFIDHGAPGRAHPFFWAAFVLSGDTAPIVAKPPIFTLWEWVSLAILFVFLLSFYAKSRNT